MDLTCESRGDGSVVPLLLFKVEPEVEEDGNLFRGEGADVFTREHGGNLFRECRQRQIDAAVAVGLLVQYVAFGQTGGERLNERQQRVHVITCLQVVVEMGGDIFGGLVVLRYIACDVVVKNGHTKGLWLWPYAGIRAER